MANKRFDYEIILKIIERDSKVLDLGCGDGELLRLLKEKNNVKGVGIENDEKMIYECVEKDVTVEHADLDEGLQDFPDKFFNYVILNFTLQETKNPKEVIHEALRVGNKVIVSFPNFAFHLVRYYIGLLGKTPQTKALPYRWDETPNLHYFTIKDFMDFCKIEKIVIDEFIGFTGRKVVKFVPNFFAEQAIFIIGQ
ncbi:MAG: methionine biosynthesis protein MetW [Candidatus Firestonebacteria bacterium]